MASSLACRSLSVFVFLLVLDGTAIFFFTRGFLLTRTELSMVSNCSDIAQCPSTCFEHPLRHLNPKQVVENVSSAGNIFASPSQESRMDDGDLEKRATSVDDTGRKCWTTPVIKKVVILIIDALRFDFVAHSRNFAGERKPWMDRLPVLQRNVEVNNRTARMFKFIADPPTTTLQRLKGLTTGGLPTFIDIGHSFGAPAIVEDNLILQLAKTGKKVILMGDDTWMQLFPTQFVEAYPFPSFNVKDLHTVDDGVIQELFPALHRTDWDVLIGHFLGVDHVGHIFGVESPLMPEKLEQYNKVIEDVVEILWNMSEPGGLFEDTLLIVMGDHGQTLNGDHGGGTPEETSQIQAPFYLCGSAGAELASTCCCPKHVICVSSQFYGRALLHASVQHIMLRFGGTKGELWNCHMLQVFGGFTNEKVETALFVLGTHNPSSSLLPNTFPSSCDRVDPVSGCISTFAQLDFSVTLAALLGVPFPFGSVGHVNPDLYSLFSGAAVSISEIPHEKELFMFSLKALDQYQEVLCVNSWQVRRYFEGYSKVSITGFPPQDQLHLDDLYTKAQILSHEIKGFENRWVSADDGQSREAVILEAISAVKRQIVAYRQYLSAAASLARSQWTQFGIGWMVVGFSLLIACIAIRAVFLYQLYHNTSRSFDKEGTSVKKIVDNSTNVQEVHQTRKWGSGGQVDSVDIRTFAISLLAALHLFSLFSNSYIVAEGVVIYFLIASSGLLYLRSAVQAHSKVLQALCFLALIWIMPKIHVLPIFKGAVAGPSQGGSKGVISGPLHRIMLTCATIMVPLGVLSWLPTLKSKENLVWHLVTFGMAATNCLIGLHWLVADLSSGEILSISDTVTQFTRLQLPRMVYAISVLLILATGVVGKFGIKRENGKSTNYRELVSMESTALLAGASGTLILLMGRKGPLLVLLSVLEVGVFLELQRVSTSSKRMRARDNQNLEPGAEIKNSSFRATVDWSLIAAQLFFCTGHSCAFDGLHYSAAFIGFDDFGFFQQGVLLATETFGASHFLPVIGLPLLALGVFGSPQGLEFEERLVVLEISKGYLWFGLLKALVTSITTASVGIQRRHLMVWGIFAPKYVFDAVGFLLVDVFIILSASVYFSLQGRKLKKRNQHAPATLC